MAKLNPLTAVEGGKTFYTGAGANYNFQAGLVDAFLTANTEYTIDEIFVSVGEPQVKLQGVAPSFPASLFGKSGGVALKAGSIVPGSGGANGTFALVIPAPAAGGTQATGTFTVAGGVVTAVTITLAGTRYTGDITLANSAFAASAGLTGAGAVLAVA